MPKRGRDRGPAPAGESGHDATRRGTADPVTPPMTPDDGPAPRGRVLSRRRFVALLAAGAGAALTAPARAATTTRRKSTRTSSTGPASAAPLSPKVAKGLEEQRESLAKTLKTVREFDLPPGSEQGFVFRPLAARRKP
jgi:hypothetical protein